MGNRFNKIVIIGGSGSGKDFLKNHMVSKFKLKKEVSYTTRPPRGGEKDGVDYHFVSEDVFAKMLDNNEFLQSNKFANGFSYGTSMKEFESSDIFIMSPYGVELLRKKNPSGRFASLVVYLKVDADIRIKRISERKKMVEDPKERIKMEIKEFSTFRDYNILVTDPEFDLDRISNMLKNLTIL